MTTFSEFVSGPEFEKMISSKKYPKYKIKFSKIIEKAGVGDSYLTDRAALKKLYSTRSWNWFSFFFSVYWAVFCKIKMGWFGAAILFILFLIEDSGVLGTGFFQSTTLSGIVTIVMSVMFGLWGNSLYFQEIINNYNAGCKDKVPSSILNVFILIAAFFGYVGISMYLFLAQL